MCAGEKTGGKYFIISKLVERFLSPVALLKQFMFQHRSCCTGRSVSYLMLESLHLQVIFYNDNVWTILNYCVARCWLWGSSGSATLFLSTVDSHGHSIAYLIILFIWYLYCIVLFNYQKNPNNVFSWSVYYLEFLISDCNPLKWKNLNITRVPQKTHFTCFPIITDCGFVWHPDFLLQKHQMICIS